MAKGYWIARLDVEDDDAYATYRSLNAVAFARYGGRFLVRGGAAETVKGLARRNNVVLEFPSHEAALACWRSPEYQAAMAYLDKVGPVDLTIVAGYDGVQPGEG